MLVFLIILSLFIFMVLVLHSYARIYRHYVFKQAKGNLQRSLIY